MRPISEPVRPISDPERTEPVVERAGWLMESAIRLGAEPWVELTVECLSGLGERERSVKTSAPSKMLRVGEGDLEDRSDQEDDALEATLGLRPRCSDGCMVLNRLLRASWRASMGLKGLFGGEGKGSDLGLGALGFTLLSLMPCLI